ncbi:hypothetical protein BU24DRAFT_422832 [Aaosphaeria arxii CBS 175.79]|uniref:WW domain-containing protein n=1 Tax=Aaosphaeria arxii CBS 175.79 TaxID=1450172 RepID=A0A6A5XU67_9PLEO|nr:uncharacterized protein BU24DRAFT_422832 [Aaosphaeria arxii CBS 175.79]KAF2016493.1 hypothetical protein BU24DRAFT_422832 [Aaosphaeria arxii CBS 175.79]
MAAPPQSPPDSGPTDPTLPKLPAGWIAQWDASSQKYYCTSYASYYREHLGRRPHGYRIIIDNIQ